MDLIKADQHDWSGTSIADMFRRRTDYDLSHEDFAEFTKVCLMYMFRSISAAGLRKWLKAAYEIPDEQVQAVSDAVRDEGYLVTNLKLFLADCYYYRAADRDAAMLHSHDFDLAERAEADACLAAMINSREMRKAFKGHLDNPLYIPVTLAEMDMVMGWLAEDCRAKVSKTAYRTRFIHKAYGSGLDREDIMQFLAQKGLKSVWDQYPRLETYSHALALARRQIGNAGINLIKHFTTDKNSVIRRISENEFAAVITSMDKVVGDDEGGGTTVGDLIADPDSGKQFDFIEYVDTVEKLQNLANSDLEQDMINCILGFKNSGFTQWLAANAAQTHRVDNDELFEKLLGKRDRYDDYLIGFLDEAYPLQNSAGEKVDGSAEMKELLDEMRLRMQRLVKY